MARCLQTLILARNQVLGPEFSSIEEWLGRNTAAYYEILARTGEGHWRPGNDATSWVRFNLRAHHMQAQIVWHRVQESEELWTRLDQLVADRGLPERSVNALFTAALGLRVRRGVYQGEIGVEYASANRDLKAMVSAGLLEARGETRGRYYLGTDALKETYAEIRSRHRSRVLDPYQTLADIPPALDADPDSDTLF
jgi:Fic family protein